ncbi:histidine phosphatase family protein [Mechercharimyces sp. CAU 1602]|uniref:histidine phosphatase family protein n=1 Tax=Mechercharimyces sp. CAU 1602 TaxID=2973933 RepID=UPI00216345B6|nr:histidine phosphatase family protein [Mechercharimyces sp. CAU 1602]MCS1351853.1 histidine phosphatase family protein [Mechercharimyces sp. CAU 1602]
MRVIWVRHGQTKDNEENRYGGERDTELTPLGQKESEQVATKLAKIEVSGLYCSDLRRAQETATAIQSHHPHLHLRTTAQLRELSFGEWEGLTYDDVYRLDREWLSCWLDDPWQVSPPRGETLQEMSGRLSRWLSSILTAHALTETVVVVSHGGPIRWFMADIVRRRPQSFWETSIPNGGCLIAEWNGQQWKEMKAYEGFVSYESGEGTG